MAPTRENANSTQRLRRAEKKLRILQYEVIILVVAVVVLAANVLYPTIQTALKGNSQPLGHTTAGIDALLSSAQLAVINNASNNNFEIAGERLLNRTINNQVVVGNTPQAKALLFNGKPSVVYIGAISCIFCGENRWAMALALSRFGNFSRLYIGYSSLGDGDVPTLYWNYNNYTGDAVTYGNYYNSKYINFISAEYDSNISQGFQIQPISYFISKAPNQTYVTALKFMNSTNDFQGTPFTFWGTSIVGGADAVVFGNTTPSSSSLPLTNMTHQQVLDQLQNFNDQFAWSEYAAADVYIAQTCPSIKNSAPICQLPAIQKLELIMGL